MDSEPLIVGFEQGLDYQTDIALIPQQLIEDNRISSDAAMFFIRAHYLMMSRRLPVYRKTIIEFMPNMSDYKYRKVLGELESFGYIKRTQVRFDNGRYGGVRYVLSVPKIEHAMPTIEEHLEKIGVSKTPGQSRQLIFNGRSGENGENQSFPRSVPSVDFQRTVDANQQNPRSVPSVDFRHAAHITQPNLSFNLSTPSGFPKDSFSYAVNHVKSNGDEERKGELENQKGEVRLGCDGRPEKLRQALESSDGYELRNCTMEQAVEVYEEVCKGCTELLHYDDQLQICLPKIDAMLETIKGAHVIEPLATNWRGQVMDSIRFVAGNYKPKRYPSYWLEDYGPTVLRHAKVNFEFYRPPFDPEENARRLEEVKAQIKTRLI